MNLEDHLGDILSKTRAMTRITVPAAAQAAGVSPAEYSALEKTGEAPERLQFVALASLLGLDGQKLKALARGWLPRPVELSTWRHLRPITTVSEGMAVNCFLIWDGTTREAALFDTGWDAGEALRWLAAEQLRLTHLFITHSHDDHVAGVPELQRAFPSVRMIGSKEAEGVFAVGSLRVSGRPTPGHAADGVTWLVNGWPGDAPLVALTGDALFAGSIGRGFQSWNLSRRSVREQIFTLPLDTLVCPGHGPLTTVGEETAHNPFFPDA